MKLLFREPGRLVFRVSRREHEALLTLLRMRAHFPRGPRPLTGDTATEARLRAAQADLDAALGEFRQELTTDVEALLADAGRCTPRKGGGYELTLNTEASQMLLQALNEVRVGAWEKLGCPDFESGNHPDLTEENFLCFWALQMTDLFQGVLLAALAGEEE